MLDELAERIAAGHAMGKHAQRDLARLGVSSREELQQMIKDRIERAERSWAGDAVKQLDQNRTAYWDRQNRTIIITVRGAKDGGTIYRPSDGFKGFQNLKPRRAWMKVLETKEQTARIEFDLNELQAVYGALTVALSELEESHFATRVGYSKDATQALLAKLGQAIDEIP